MLSEHMRRASGCGRSIRSKLMQYASLRRWYGWRVEYSCPDATKPADAGASAGLVGSAREYYGATVAQTAKGIIVKLVEPLGLKIWTSHVDCDAGNEASTLLLVPLVSGFR